MPFKAKEVIYETTNSGCIIPTSHKLNKDGYFRRNIKRVWVMNHRLVWEDAYGKIPDGYEVNHKCKNRACCNLKHLELLTGTDHAIETNINRFKEQQDYGYSLWLSGKKAREIAEIVGVCESSAYGWVRKWRQ